MRSRYTAYVKRAYTHLRDSLTEEQREDFSEEETSRWAEQSEWLGLTILRTEAGGPDDEYGLVEFSARFKAEGKNQEHVEAATFTKTEGNWYYSGQATIKGNTVTREGPKIGRNDPCPCGSGKKFKRCCGANA